MPAKQKNETEQKKSILVVPSRVISRPDELEGGEETEIAAQISVPEEGGWGWVVLVAAFSCIMILDGICFTFGCLIQDLKQEFQTTDSNIAFVNSLAVSFYFLLGPLASACINRFGFRLCCMTGSVIVTCSFLCTYFSTNYVSLCVFYGAFAGLGYCLINLSSALVVGFYFEKLRALTLAIAATGSSVGIAVMAPINTYIIGIAGWRVVTMFHTGLFGITYFLGMTYRPLLSLTVITTTDDPTRTVTYLPNLASASRTGTNVGGVLMPTATERLFSAVSNANFPTAASVVVEGLSTTPTQPGPSTGPAVSKITLRAHSPHGGISKRQLKQVQSIISKSSVQDKTKKNVEVTVHVDEPKKRKWWQRLFHWEEHVQESRPMYRDDAFYAGNIEKLPEYQKSMMDTPADGKTGLEYQMAVSRAVTAVDLKEKRGVFTTAARRVLATMMDPNLLKKKSFLLLSTSGFVVYLGYLVPYVFMLDRSITAGIEFRHSNLFLTVIGTANAIGRLVMGALATKYDPLKLYIMACVISGLATILSSLSYDVYYQYGYCTIFGFFISSFASLRSIVIVSLYGLDKLTNATGILLLFQGCGSLISTPMAGMLKENFNYDISFYVAGTAILLGGIMGCFIKILANKEIVQEQNAKKGTLPEDKKTPVPFGKKE
ncbi:monocarboxylate transporter 3-like [Plodia interpunctella]|uniref:monocarboxylate transporter 3-like n=1 Tax=Plodia interpunctella TaxID=58824 RepID=UPI002367F09C|nr:monocarboxylate transporter 3-like [Plodia interpunctella]